MPSKSARKPVRKTKPKVTRKPKKTPAPALPEGVFIADRATNGSVCNVIPGQRYRLLRAGERADLETDDINYNAGILDFEGRPEIATWDAVRGYDGCVVSDREASIGLFRRRLPESPSF